MNVRTRAVLYFFSVCIAAMLVAGCVALPSLENRTVSRALPADQSRATKLAAGISRSCLALPGKSGIVSFAEPLYVVVARPLITRPAERTFNIQYYIWHKVMPGTLLFQAMRESADRGVRVRFLLDD